MRPMWIALATQIFLLLGFCGVFYSLGMLTPSLIWLSILVSHTARLILTVAVFRGDRWVNIKVDID